MKLAVCTWNAGQILHKGKPLDFSAWLSQAQEDGKGEKEHIPDMFAIGLQ